MMSKISFRSDDIFQHCQVRSYNDDDQFVGLKGDANQLTVYFPYGYQLSTDDIQIRVEIRELLSVLGKLSTGYDGFLKIDSDKNLVSTNFPISSYLNIIFRFLNNESYYADIEPNYGLSDTGAIDWNRTIKMCRPFATSNSNTLMFQGYVRKRKSYKKNQLITKIHKFCVYESFRKIGILFTSALPERPDFFLDPQDRNLINSCINILYLKRLETRNDADDILFESMINLLRYYGSADIKKEFYFGSNKFEHVWEKMIDKVFGISREDKQNYFPRAYWRIHLGRDEDKLRHPLEPDSIMILKNNEGQKEYYVLDAKYYKFGITGNISDLPNSSDINKQITYGQFVKKKAGGISPYNAFIMPYNKNNNIFQTHFDLINSSSASGDWICHEKEPHEKIQGILVDTKTLFNRYQSGHNLNFKQLLAAEIKKQYD